MRSLLLLGVLIGNFVAACGINYPLEYLSHASVVVITGEIERIDSDLEIGPPHARHYYSLAHLRVDKVLKADAQIEPRELFSFKMESRKGGSTSASVFWKEAMAGTWFFISHGEDDWHSVYRRPISVAEQVERELNYNYKRKFGRTFGLSEVRLDLWWPEKFGEKAELSELIEFINAVIADDTRRPMALLLIDGKTINAKLALDKAVNPELEISSFNMNRSLSSILEGIRAQHALLDFEYQDEQILIFNRDLAEQQSQ